MYDSATPANRQRPSRSELKVRHGRPSARRPRGHDSPGAQDALLGRIHQEVKQQFKRQNKYTVELVPTVHLTVAPSDIKVPVPITGLQLPGWDKVTDMAEVAQQLLKATGSPQRLPDRGRCRSLFLPARSAVNAAPFKYTFSQTEPAP